MKKLLIVIISVMVAVGLVACGPSPEQLAENMLEEMVEENMEDADIDMDLDLSGDLGWPNDELPDYVPEISGINVTGTMETDGGLIIMFEGCDQAKVDAFVAQMESNGWDKFMDSTVEEGYTASFKMDNNEFLTLFWSKEDGAGDVTYGKG